MTPGAESDPAHCLGSGGMDVAPQDREANDQFAVINSELHQALFLNGDFLRARNAGIYGFLWSVRKTSNF